MKHGIIQLEDKARPIFCQRLSKILSELLNQPVSFIDILNELFLYEMGAEPKNITLSCYVILHLEQVRDMIDERKAKEDLKAAVTKYGL